MRAELAALRSEQKKHPDISAEQQLLDELRAMRKDLDSLKDKTRPNGYKWRGPVRDQRFAIGIKGFPFVGNRRAPITIVKAFEFACPASYVSREFDREVLRALGSDVKIVYRDFVVHPTRAWTQAFAACAAHRQGKWDQMQEAIWEKGFKARQFDRALYEKMANDLGLKMNSFKADYEGACNKRTRVSHAELRAIGTAGTPTYFINGKVLTKRSIEKVKEMAAEELRLIRKSGKKGSAYYQDVVMRTGKRPSALILPTVPN